MKRDTPPEELAIAYLRGDPSIDLSREVQECIVYAHVGECWWKDMVCYGGPPLEQVCLTPDACEVCSDHWKDQPIRQHPDREGEP